MSNVNIGWQYYKGYYHGFDFRKAGKGNDTYQENHFRSKNEALKDLQLKDQEVHLLDFESDEMTQIKLETTYPGLMSGTGLSHETKSQGEAKLGFAFDHTTGLPYLPASSVKGAFRSLFPQFVNQQKAKKLKENRSARYELIESLIEMVAGLSVDQQAEKLSKLLESKGIDATHTFKEKGKDLNFIDLLELEIFEGISPKLIEKNEDLAPALIPQSVYVRDIFFDAYPMESKKHGGRFIDFDYITPHKHPKHAKLDAFSDPTPIKFLKILPSVTFHFQFDLKAGLLSVEEKKKLFEQMLLLKGAGAKTNVGYGQFQEPKGAKKYQKGEEVEGLVIERNPDNWIRVRIDEADWEKSFQVRENVHRELTEGNTYTFKVNLVNENGSIRSIKYTPPQRRPGGNRNQRKRR